MKKRANPDSEQNIRRIDTKPRAKNKRTDFRCTSFAGGKR